MARGRERRVARPAALQRAWFLGPPRPSFLRACHPIGRLVLESALEGLANGCNMSVIEEDQRSQRQAEEFSRQADQPAPGLVVELIDFLRHNKKWWLGPIIAVLLLVGLLAVLAASPLAPFIYPLF